MPAPANVPLRVAECGGCGQLFAVYETAGEVACPACDRPNPVESLEVAELKVATSVPVEVKAPEPKVQLDPLPEPIAVEFSEAEPPQAAEPKEDRPPTVAEWLVRSESQPTAAERSTDTEATEAAEPELASKPSLSESLGWSAGSFQLDNSKPTPEAEPAQSPASYEPAPADAESEFKFDFGGNTPLDTQPAAPGQPEAEFEAEAYSVQEAESAGIDLEAGDESPSPAYDWIESDEQPARRGWFGPLTAAAGLLVVAAPLAYFGWDAFNEGVAEASDSREPRASLAEVMSEEEPPIPWEGADEPASLPEEAADAEPMIVDSETKPASFDADGFDPMPEAESPTPEPDSFAGADTPPADPFNAPLPQATEAEQASRYDQPVGDRYAKQASADVPIENFDETVSLPQEPPAQPPRPVQRGVGLANAPTYSVADLNAAIGPAVSAGQGFATGTMSDPEQVKTMGQHYARLCYLAQVLTLFDPDSSDPSRMTAELEAADVFKRMFIEGRPREESRQIAGPWIGWTGRPHGGVFFVGKPQGMSLPGQVVQYDFQLGETTVPVLMADKLDTTRFLTAGAMEIGVLGVVVENPRQWIVGYEGDAERVVWARKTLPLREPKQL